MNTAKKSKRQGGLRLSKLLARALAERERGFRKAFKRCRRDVSEHTVHELRVSLRRLIATLKVLASILSAAEIREARRFLKKLLRALGPLRDAHIQLLYFEELLPQFAALEKPFRASAKREQKLMRNVGQVLHKTKLRGVQRQLARILTALRKKNRAVKLQARQLATLLAAVGEAWVLVEHRRERVDVADVATIHRVRVALKNFRYMVETLQPLLPRATTARLDKLRDFQARLGDIQDLEVVADYLSAYATARKPKTARSLASAQHELGRKHRELLHAFMQNKNRLDESWSPLPQPPVARRKRRSLSKRYP